MESENRNTLCKNERLHGRNAVDRLFKKAGSHSMVAFPLRVVYILTEKENTDDASVKMLVSVPKRHFKRAVKRNRVKRQVREAYRKNKHDLLKNVDSMKNRLLSLAFIWLDDNLHSSKDVEKKVEKLLVRVGEKVSAENENRKTGVHTEAD